MASEKTSGARCLKHSNMASNETTVARSLEQMVLLLLQNAWIYDFKLTRFFLDRVWEHLPSEWNDVLQSMTIDELARLPFGDCQPSWPASLNQFIQDCLSLSLPRDITASQRPVSLSGSWPSQAVHLSGPKNDTSCRDSGTGPQLSSENSLPILRNDSICRKPVLDDSKLEQLNETSDLESEITVFENMEGSAKTADLTETLGFSVPIKSEESVVDTAKQVRTNSTEDSMIMLNPTSPSEIDDVIRKGMSNKKLHEVCHMTSLIDHVMKRSKCNAVVDVGSGLVSAVYLSHVPRKPVFEVYYQGYLGQVLHTKFGHPVLGLEGKQCHTSGAEKRAVKNSSCSFLHNVTCELQPTEESNQQLLFLINDWFTSLSQEVSTCCHQTGSSSSSSRKSCQIQPNDSQSVTSHQTGSRDTASQNSQTNQTVETQSVTCDLPVNSATRMPKNLSFSHEMSDRKETVCDKVDTCFDPELQTQTPLCAEKGAKMKQENANVDAKCQNLTDSNGITEKFECNSNLEGIQVADFNNIGPRICMVGLHCCGDLTPTMLKCFRELDCIRSLCCVSCCYHRMRFDECSSQFENFPVSSLVRGIIDRLAPGWNPGPYGTRLAAQETRARWWAQTTRDHEFHIRNVAYRGLLEVCLERGKFTLKKTSRKLTHERDFHDFTTYVDAISKHIEVSETEKEEVCVKCFQDEMTALYQEYQQYFTYIEPITALQVLLQPVLESLIYRDRSLWLLEHGITCDIVPVFNEFISPRNLALVAVK